MEGPCTHEFSYYCYSYYYSTFVKVSFLYHEVMVHPFGGAKKGRSTFLKVHRTGVPERSMMPEVPVKTKASKEKSKDSTTKM